MEWNQNEQTGLQGAITRIFQPKIEVKRGTKPFDKCQETKRREEEKGAVG